MIEANWIGISSDEVFAIHAPLTDDPTELAEEADCNYVTDISGATSIRNGIDALLGDRPAEMDNPHSIVDFLFQKFDPESVKDALAQHGFKNS